MHKVLIVVLVASVTVLTGSIGYTELRFSQLPGAIYHAIDKLNEAIDRIPAGVVQHQEQSISVAPMTAQEQARQEEHERLARDFMAKMMEKPNAVH